MLDSSDVRTQYTYASGKWDPGQPITQNKMVSIENELIALASWAIKDYNELLGLEAKFDYSKEIAVGIGKNNAIEAINTVYEIAAQARTAAQAAGTGNTEGQKAWAAISNAGVQVDGNNVVTTSLEQAIAAMQTIIAINKKAGDAYNLANEINGKWDPMFGDGGTYTTMYADYNNAYKVNYITGSNGSSVKATSLEQKITDMDDKIGRKLNTSAVYDGLDSDNASVPLSAKQGKVLNENKIATSAIATNLTTDDNSQVLSAKQGKLLNDNKLEKSDVVDDLVTDSSTRALSAKQGKYLNDHKLNDTDVVHVINSNDTVKALGANVGPMLVTEMANRDTAVGTAANEYTDTQVATRIPIANIANNLTTDAAVTGYVLDARQGKVLATSISNAQTEINNAHYATDGTTLDARFDNIDEGGKPSRSLPNVITEINNAHRTSNDTLNDRFDAIDGDVSALNTSVGSLNTTVGSLQTGLSDLQTEINDAHKGAYNTLKKRFDALDNDITGITSNVSTIATELGMLNNDQTLKTLGTRIDDIETEITNAHRQNAVDDQGNAVTDSLALRFSQAEARLDAMSGFSPEQVQQMNNAINANTTSINNLTTDLGNTNTRVNTIAEELGMLNQDNTLKTLGSRIDGLASDLSDISDEIDAAHRNGVNDDTLDNRFDDIESDISDLDTAINAQTTGLAARMTAAEGDIDTLESTIGDANTGLAATKAIADTAAAAAATIGTGFSTQHTVSDELALKATITYVDTQLSGKASTSVVNNISTTIVLRANEVNFDVDGFTPTTLKSGNINDKDDYLIENTESGQYYYWKHITVDSVGAWHLMGGAGGGTGSSSGLFVASLQAITEPDENIDYFVGNTNDGFVHYRYIASLNEFVVIGSVLDTTGIKRYNIAKSIGTNASNESVTYLDLYEFNYGQQKSSDNIDPENDLAYRIAHIELPQGGGGSGSGTTGTTCSVVYRTPQAQVLSSAETDTVKLEFLYYAYEKQDDETYILHPGTYTLRKDNMIIASGTVQSAQVIKEDNGTYSEMTSQEKANLRPNLSFDVTQYCTDNTTTNFTLTVTGARITRTRPCSVELVNLQVSSSFNDQVIHNAGEQLRIPLVISGTKINKTIYVTVDEGTENEQVITQPHGENAAATTTVTIPGTYLTPGVHSINVKFSQIIGQDVEPSFSNILYYDVACRDTANDTTVLLSSSSRGHVLTMEQYATLKIPYYLYVPTGTRISIVKTNSLNGKTVVEEGVTGAGEYLFKAVSVENNSVTRYTVTIGCRAESTDPLSPSITFQIDVTPNQYSIEPVLDHLVFDFNPAGYINNPENEEDKFWVDDTNSNIKLSIPAGENFDWDNGGWKYDEEMDSPYFCVKAGSRAQINYSLFQEGMEGNSTEGGSEFKCIFKATNVRNPEAVFLTSTDNTPSTVIEYATNKTAGDQSTEEGDEDTLFSSYFNTKEGHVLTYKKGKVDSDKVAVVVIDAASLPQGADTSYIASDAVFDDLLDKAKKKAKKKNIDNYADMIVNDIAGTDELPGYHGSDRDAVLAYVNKTDLCTDKATAEGIWNSLQNDATWAEFRADTNVFAAVEIDMTQLIKNYAYTYEVETRYVRNYASMEVIDGHDDTYAKRSVKRVVATKANGDQSIVEIEINYERENNVVTYQGIEIVRKVLNEISRPRGLEMRAHRSNIYLNNGTLTYPYSEDDIIEFEYNVNHPVANKYNAPIVMYEDGVPSAAMLYPTYNNALEQTSRGNLIIGSDDCDIWIYRMKFYSKELSNKEILSNFYADALNPEQMVDRYVRNTNSYTDAADPNSITPQSVAAACPDLRIIMIEAPNLTGGKNSFIKNTKIRCIYKGTEDNPARPEDNWVAFNAYHAGQGTSSDAYGAAGRNLDIIFGFDGVDQLIAPKAKNNYRFDSNYKSIVVTGVDNNDNTIGTFDTYVDQILNNKNEGKNIGDPGYVERSQLLQQDHFNFEDLHVYQNGTGKVNFTDESVPNNWFNIKLNIASSENTNNALLQKRFDRYLPYETPGMKKDSRVKNDMEFFNCVVFLREVGTPTEFTSDKTIAAENRQWHFYGIGNIGDSKKTDNTRINIPNDPNEFCVEVSDNGLTLSGFSSGVYYANEEQTETTFNQVGNYGIVYPITTAQWEDENNEIRPTLYDFEEDGGWDSSVEFRYDISTKDGNTIADSAAEKALAAERQAHNKEMFARMYEWVVTAPKSGSNSFNNHLRDWFIEDSPIYWYLFTERYTMIDSRAKNTFYHYGKVFITQEEADGTNIPDLLAAWNTAKEGSDQAAIARAKTAYDTAVYIHENADCFVIEGEERTGSITYPNAAHINNGYRFEMWDYDNDTALGINNNGQMVFDAGLEDVDRTANAWVYNEATNVFWKRIRNETESKLRMLYSSKKADCFNAENLITEFDNWQEQFAENLWRMDFERKYYRPYIEANEITYLQSMANGRKKYQRREFERNMCVYIDSKYILGDAYDPNDFIQFRPTNQQHVDQNKYLAIKLYSPMYINFTIGNQSNVSGNHVRGRTGETYYVNTMEGITDLQNIQTKIFNASHIMEISGLQDYYPDDLRFASAKKLRKLVLGGDYIKDENGNNILDANDNPIPYYNNNTTTISLGAGNPILEDLDVRNCAGLAAQLDLAGCISLQNLYATGTSISEVVFATNGLLKRADLPSTMTSLKFTNLSLFTTLNLTGYSNIISYISQNTFRYNSKEVVENILAKVTTLQLNDIDWTIDNISDLEKFANKQEILGNKMSLAGQVFVTGEWSEVEQEGYRAIWPDLIVTGIDDPQHKKVKFLLVYEYEVNGVPTQYRTYVNENADIIDIAYNGTIDMPTRPQTAQYKYTFGSYTTGNEFIELSGWSFDPDTLPNRETLAERWDRLGYQPRVQQNNTHVYAVFNGEDRRYPVKWYLERNNTNLVKTSNAIAYGAGTTLDAPTVQDIHTAGFDTMQIQFNTNTNPKEVALCRIFKGWEKLPININPNAEDTSYNIYAEWEELRNIGLPSVFTSNSISTEMKLAVLSAMTDAERAQYAAAGQQYTFTTGHTGPADDVTYKGELLIGPDATHLMSGTSGTPRAYSIARFDSTTTLKPFRSSIQPLRAGNDAFTIAIDYSFDANQVDSQRNNIESVLVSCYESGVDSEHTAGFKLYYNTVDNKPSPRISWGDTTVSGGVTNYSRAVGNSASASKRNMIVLRHPKGSQTLYIYSGINSAGKMITDLNDATLIQQINWTNFNTDAYLVFGNLTLDNAQTNVIAGKGIIYWAKYWNEDLGVGECRRLASWNHEQMTFAIEEFSGMTHNSRFVYMTGNAPNVVFTSVNTSSYGYASYEADISASLGSTIGWPNSPLQSIANKRIFYSLPTTLQSIISKSPIRSRIATMSNSTGFMPQYEIGNSTVAQTQDYIFFPSAVEHGETNETYLGNESQGTMLWLNGGKVIIWAYDSGTSTWKQQEESDPTYMNLRFPNIPIKTTATNKIFIEYSEQTSVYDSILDQFNVVNPGDIVVNTATNAAYIYVDSTQQSNGVVTVGASRTSLFGCPSGGWVKADIYWTRSPFDQNTQTGTMMYVNAQGTLINQANNADTRGFGLNYSFAI